MIRTLSGLCALLLVCVWSATAWADHCPTSMQMPGWYVATDDEAYANATWLSPTRVRFLAESQTEAVTYLVDTSGNTPTVRTSTGRLKRR